MKKILVKKAKEFKIKVYHWLMQHIVMPMLSENPVITLLL